MPAALQPSLTPSYQLSYEVPQSPHELLTTSACSAGFGVPVPLVGYGASTHWPDSSRPASGAPVPPPAPKPMHAIHVASGATPIWLEPPSSPTMVPMVWLPCAWELRGVTEWLYGSYQL